MLQQTQVKTVLPYWERWMRALPNLAALAKAKPEKIHKLWEGLGYYTRVRNMQQAARVIIRNHEGKFPENFDDLLALPGIGRYTAGAICSIAFDQPKPILDGNVIRVLTRVFGISGNPRAKETNLRLWRLAETLVLQARPCSQFNQSLMELGALICTPREPRCVICPLAPHCAAFRQGQVQVLPNLGPRVRPTARRFIAFVAERNGRCFVRQRGAGMVNAHLWEFPNMEVKPDDVRVGKSAWRQLGIRPGKVEALCTIKHSITRYRITLEVFRVAATHETNRSLSRGRWIDRSRLGRLAFASAHKKILARIWASRPD